MNRNPGIIVGESGPGLALAAGLSLAAHGGLLATLLHGLPGGSLPPQPLETFVVEIVIEDGRLGAAGQDAAHRRKRMTLKAQQNSQPTRKAADHDDQKKSPVIEAAILESSATSKPSPKLEKTDAETHAVPRPPVSVEERDGSTGLATPLRQTSATRPQRHNPEHSAGKQGESSQSNAGREVTTPDAGTAALSLLQDSDALRQPVPVMGVSYMTGRSGNVPPEYPRRARRRGYEGRVVIRAIVTPMGAVNSTEMVESSGHDILDQAAIRAVKRWRFVPATRDSKPVVGTIDVPISFWLKDTKRSPQKAASSN